MNFRRIIYIAVIVFLAGVLIKYTGEGNLFNISGPSPLNKQDIMDDFKNLSRQEDAPELPSQDFQVTHIYFSPAFTGESGDSFYVGGICEQGTYTLKYIIYKDEQVNELTYSLKDSWAEVRLPAARFEVYQLQNNTWVKVKE